jgi:peptidoglycan hydrolase-like protein with peptidoglycan-binding domain
MMSVRPLWTRLAAGAIGVTAVAAVALAGSPASATTLKPATAARLAAAAASAAPTYTPPTRTLREGMSGADVKAMQERLISLHYWLGSATGTFNNDTLQAVYAYQAINRLTMDGVVGPLTAHALAHPIGYVPNASSVGTRIEVNINPRLQVLLYYKNNVLQLISHISSAGIAGYYTPTGWYRAWGFTSGWVTVPLGKMYNPVWLSVGGDREVYAIHGDTSVPNYPASHGCVRISDDLAYVFHTMITVNPSSGTQVDIYNRL